MDLHLTGKVAFVAGSSRGIGRAIARAFLAEGCRVALTGRDLASLEQAHAELAATHGEENLLACAGDLAEPSAIREALARVRARWGHLDILVANLGSGRGAPGPSPPEDDWDRSLEQNLRASVRLVSEVVPELVASRAGSVVLVASITGVESTPAPLPYSAAKAALVSYAKNLARQVGTHQVRVNCVAPGNVLFPGGSWEGHLARRPEEVKAMIRGEVPLQRFGTPDEIAAVVVFLSSDRASFVTGACVIADGGQTRSL